MKSKKQIQERLEMWKIILENMEKQGSDEYAMYPVRIRIFEYSWILE